MPDFETILGTGALDLSGASELGPSSLTMARNETSGLRAFRLVHYPLTGPLTAAAITWVRVVGFDAPNCEGSVVCENQTGAGFSIPFGPFTTTGGGDLVFDPIGHDGGIIDLLYASCRCGMANVKSVALRIDVLLNEAPATAHLTTFTFCEDCGGTVRN